MTALCSSPLRLAHLQEDLAQVGVTAERYFAEDLNILGNTRLRMTDDQGVNGE